jgi:hypothetical protein
MSRRDRKRKIKEERLNSKGEWKRRRRRKLFPLSQKFLLQVLLLVLLVNHSNSSCKYLKFKQVLMSLPISQELLARYRSSRKKKRKRRMK